MRWAIPLVALAVLFGAAAGKLAGGDVPVLALLIPCLLVPVLVWRMPILGVYVLFAAALLVEQFAYEVGPRAGAATSRIPLFQGIFPAGVQPADLLVGLTTLVVIMQAVRGRRRWIHRSPLLVSLGIWLAVVVSHLALGIARGGNLTAAVWEVRGFYYLSAAFILAAVLIDERRRLEPLLWILVLGSAFKALYGLIIFLSVRDLEPRPEAVLGHEESFLLGLSIILTASLWLFGIRGRLRVVSTVLLPIVLAGDMVNSRRTAWLILFAGLAAIIVVAVARLRARRRVILTFVAIGAVVGSAYLAAFWSGGGTLAQPARAVRSVVQPDERDRSSNDYREVEDYNLEVHIGNANGLGTGYGQRIVYTGLVDLTGTAAILDYVPHNGVLHVWLRTGTVGMAVFSILLCQAMVSSARLSAARDVRVAHLGGLAASAVVAYAAMGGVDMGFYWIRNSIVIGVLLGAVEGLSRTQLPRPDVELDRVRTRVAQVAGPAPRR